MKRLEQSGGLYGFRYYLGSSAWPSSDPKDSPISTLACPLLGCPREFTIREFGEFAPDESGALLRKLRRQLAAHLRGHAEEIFSIVVEGMSKD